MDTVILKQHLLLEVIDARRRGSETNVQRILAEQKIERARRRSEKYGNRETVFRYLNTHEKRPPGRPRKLPAQETQVQRTELNVTSLSYGSISLTKEHIFKQSNVSANDMGNKQLEQTRLASLPYYNQGGAEHYDFNNRLLDQTCIKSCPPHMTGGNREFITKNTCIELTGQFGTTAFQKDINYNIPVGCADGFSGTLNATSGYDGNTSMVYSPLDERPSFQIRDILSKKYCEPVSVSVSHKTSSMTQYHNYPFDGGYGGANGYNHSGSLYGQCPPEPNEGFHGREWGGEGSALPPIQCPNLWQNNQWNPEDQGNQEYWRPNTQTSLYQMLPAKGPSAAYSSPDSDTLSATELDVENISNEQETIDIDFRAHSNVINYNHCYSSLYQDNQAYAQPELIGMQDSRYDGSMTGQETVVNKVETDPLSINPSDQYSSEGNSCIFEKNTYPLTSEFGISF